MAQTAFHGSRIRQVVVSGMIRWRREVSYCNGWDEEGYCNSWGSRTETTTTAGTINGTVESNNTTVLVNGKAIATVGDRTKETVTYSRPSGSGWYLDGSYNGGYGTITTGSSTVYHSNKAVAMVGSSVRTHTGAMTTIENGSTNVENN